jgi:hypothetical protein
MSLKAFHIFFISISVLVAFGYAAWEINGFAANGDMWQLFKGIISFVAAIGLTVYGVRFMRKLKHVRMM